MKCTIQEELLTTLPGCFRLILKSTKTELVRVKKLHTGLEIENEKLCIKVVKNKKHEESKK